MALSVHQHYPRWVELAGLVKDGVRVQRLYFLCTAFPWCWLLSLRCRSLTKLLLRSQVAFARSGGRRMRGRPADGVRAPLVKGGGGGGGGGEKEARDRRRSSAVSSRSAASAASTRKKKEKKEKKGKDEKAKRGKEEKAERKQPAIPP